MSAAIKWEDATSYSRGRVGKEDPSVWAAEVITAGQETVRIVVHRHIHHSPHAWLLSCYDIGIKDVELGSGPGFTAEAAQGIAIRRCAEVAYDMSDALVRSLFARRASV